MDETKNKVKLTLSHENSKALEKRKSSFKLSFAWPLKVLLLTFCFSVGFSIFSQIINSKVGAVLSVLIILVFLFVGVVFDIIGVATTVCERGVFKSLAESGDGVAHLAFKLSSNSEKVSSFCCDIIGDICGVLSGSAGASLIVKLHFSYSGAGLILLSTITSAIIASLTVFFKALGKTIAIGKSHSIVYRLCKFLNIFIRKKKHAEKQKK